MPSDKHVIQSIGFDDSGVFIEYLVPSTVKASGLGLQSTLIIPTDDDYDDEIEALIDAARHLLLDALEDVNNPNIPTLEAVLAAEAEAASTNDEDDD